MASNPVYFTLVPEAYTKHVANPERLRLFSVDTPELVWPLNVVYKKNKYINQTLKKFIECTKETFGDKKAMPQFDNTNIAFKGHTYAENGDIEKIKLSDKLKYY